MKEPFSTRILCVVLNNVHLELQKDPVISCLHAGTNYCRHRGGGLPSLTVTTHYLCYKTEGVKQTIKLNFILLQTVYKRHAL